MPDTTSPSRGKRRGERLTLLCTGATPVGAADEIYSHKREAPGNQKGLLGLIFNKSQNQCRELTAGNCLPGLMLAVCKAVSDSSRGAVISA